MNSMYDDIRASFHSIWHRRWLALVVAWVVCVVGWLVVELVPNAYQSHARIYVQLYDPLAAQVGIGESDRQHDIDRVRDTLTSATHLEKVIRATRLGDHITTRKQMDAAIVSLGKAIQVTSDQNNLFSITATSDKMALSDADNAKLSQAIVANMIDIFRDENLTLDQSQMRDTMQFLDTQLAQRQKELEAAEQRRLNFETAHPELAQGGVSLIQRLESDHAQQRGIEGDLAAAQSALAAVQGQLSATPQSIPGSGPQGGPRGALSQAVADLNSMKARGLTDNHPDVIATRNQIAVLRQQVQHEGSAGAVIGIPNPAYSSLQSLKADREATIQALMARKASVEQDIAQATALQMADPDLMAQAQNISRDYDVLKQQYEKLLQNREEMRLKGEVSNAHNSVKFQVIDPPLTPRTPTAPNRPLLLFLVLVAGAAAGVGVAFAVGELKSTFATTSKLERTTGLPVLGAISQALSPAGKAEQSRKVRRFVNAAGALGLVFILLMAMEFAQRSMVA